jgi:patatin-like phospholipase/acyl hydrolase
MCTTAAPTFFPQYSFNDTAYVDGGVHANNPAMIAYSHATKIYRQTINNNRVRLLSWVQVIMSQIHFIQQRKEISFLASK